MPESWASRSWRRARSLREDGKTVPNTSELGFGAVAQPGRRTANWRRPEPGTDYRTSQTLGLQLVSSLVDQLGVIATDADADVVFMNRVAVALTGWKADEIQTAPTLALLGLLAGGIAHDFNNILTAILGNIGLAKPFAEPGTQLFAKLKEAETATERAHGSDGNPRRKRDRRPEESLPPAGGPARLRHRTGPGRGHRPGAPGRVGQELRRTARVALTGPRRD